MKLHDAQQFCNDWEKQRELLLHQKANLKDFKDEIKYQLLQKYFTTLSGIKNQNHPFEYSEDYLKNLMSSIDDPAVKKLLEKEIAHTSGNQKKDETSVIQPRKKIGFGKKKKKKMKKKKSVTTLEKIEESVVELKDSSTTSQTLDLPVSKLRKPAKNKKAKPLKSNLLSTIQEEQLEFSIAQP